MDEKLKQKLVSYVIEAISDPGKYYQHDNYVSKIEKEIEQLLK